MNFRQKAVMFLATGCFIGKIPFAPGTFGSLEGLPLSFLLSKLNLSITILCIFAFILFAVWIANAAETILNKNDPGCIVIDEIAGMAVTLAGLPFNLFFTVTGFITFRVLDILKPFPIRYLEKRFSGGVGVVLDDVAAGIFANILLRALLFLIGKT
ncbi:phosphatidylglycerophosphatase A [Thermodesulfobacteriota bacterium]